MRKVGTVSGFTGITTVPSDVRVQPPSGMSPQTRSAMAILESPNVNANIPLQATFSHTATNMDFFGRIFGGAWEETRDMETKARAKAHIQVLRALGAAPRLRPLASSFLPSNLRVRH